MEYTITERNTIINTHVVFIINDQEVEVVVSHFEPKSEEEIIKGIENRYLSEKKRIDELLIEENGDQ